MTRADLVSAVANGAGISKKQADAALTAAIEAVTDALKKGDKVSLSGFGTFLVKHTPERTVRNPRTKEIQQAPAKNTPRFRPGKALKDAVNP